MSLTPIAAAGGSSADLSNRLIAGALVGRAVRGSAFGPISGSPDISQSRVPAIRSAPGADPSRSVISTGYQRNDDGDEAFLGSRLPSLSSRERQDVAELAARDAEVRAHELAHLAAAGSLARGGPSYTYTTGPDGRRYATGGSVQIDTTAGATPQETIAKAQRIRAAALAPAEPSSQDLAIAAEATRLEAEARRAIQSLGSDAPPGDATGAVVSDDLDSLTPDPAGSSPESGGAPHDEVTFAGGVPTSAAIDLLA